MDDLSNSTSTVTPSADVGIATHHVPRTGRASWRTPAREHGLVVCLYLLVALVVMWPMFGPGTPPGVDPPLFLHLGWVVQLALTGQLDSPLLDPYWYGGHPYLQAYAPLSHALIGLLTALTPISIEVAYRVLLFAAYVALGLSVYALALEYGLRRFGAILSGLLVLTSYPVLAGLALYGWFSTLVALPLGVFGFFLLERGLRLDDRRAAIVSGALFGAMVLANLQTSLAFALALTPWVVYRLAVVPSGRGRLASQEEPSYMDNGRDRRPGETATRPRARRRVVRLVAYSGVTALVVAGIWASFAVPHLLDVDYQREPPGNWETASSDFGLRLFDRSFIGVDEYPFYMGIAQTVLGVAGLLCALVMRSRLVAVAPVLLLLLWFAMGQEANPLIERYPFFNFDIARFSLFMMPFISLFAGVSMDAAAWRARELVRRRALPRQVAVGVVGLAGLLAMAIPTADVAQARPVFAPVQIEPEIGLALEWLEHETAPDATVLGLGLRYWGAWWIPYHAARPVMDGWNDEGTARWGPVLEVRTMGWRREVDIERLHGIMAEFDTDYLLIAQWSRYEAPDLFEAQVRETPHLFEPRASWNSVSIYRRAE